MTRPSKIVVVVGTRPEAVKLAPVIHALKREPWARVTVLATAQHRQLLDQVLKFFGIETDIDLDLMRPGQSLADLTSRMIDSLDGTFALIEPDLVLGQGDTTTVLAASLCAFYRRIPFAHVEAGLRTHERLSPFPEEMNRVLVGRLADVHFAPTARARGHLLDEGIPPAAIEVTGNTVIDALVWASPRVDRARFAPKDGRRGILVTAHRRESFGPPLEGVCQAILDIVTAREDTEVLFPVHPNPNVRGVVDRMLADHPRVRLCAPLDYPDFVAAMASCYLVLTDSGGVQEEAPTLGKPVLVLRENTERPEGIDAGTAKVVGTDRHRIVEQTLRLLDDSRAYAAMAHAVNPYGDGRAAQRIVTRLRRFLGVTLAPTAGERPLANAR
ncbi:MAG: UDP-N-acetylglucosamine 2-epimerase (non-hydrolyzing) [Planctomycetes bacterium]|nr:UDP-N-acetylglucosamine 2-epimerase (non-hydrolyzing) [Planctomycetota bacterium]